MVVHFFHQGRPVGRAVTRIMLKPIGIQGPVEDRFVGWQDGNLFFIDAADRFQKRVLADRFGRDLVKPFEVCMFFQYIIDDPGKGSCGESGKNGAAETSHLAVSIAQEPFDQSAGGAQLSADDRRSKSEATGAADLAEVLAASVNILGVRDVALAIHPLVAGENTIGADVNQPSLIRPA